MKELFRKPVMWLGVGGVFFAVGATLLALSLMFASLGLESDKLTRWAGEIFALSRVGLVAALAGGVLYAGFFVDWSAQSTPSEGGPMIDVTPKKDDHNTLD